MLEPKGKLKKDCPICEGRGHQQGDTGPEHLLIKCSSCDGMGRVTEYRWKTLRGINVKRRKAEAKK